MKFPAILLFPFAVLYDAITGIRNRLYDTGIKPSASFDVPVIGVGNLAVGGTGKSPMVEYLVRLISPERKVATLSRGYGRKTKGFRIAAESDTPLTIGDEPYQFYRKFANRTVVAVGEERAMAIPYVLDAHADTGVIILDDALQHRRVKPSFQILLTDHSNLFVDDYVLPAGRLRESKRGAARADVVVVTKCPPHIEEEEMINIEGRIRSYTARPVFFSTICYGNLLPLTDDSPYKPEQIIVLSGIANPVPFETYLGQNYRVLKYMRFADHHTYSEQDMRRICEAAAAVPGAVVVTTEKDAVKLDTEIFRSASVGLYYLPIETEFLKNGKEFDELVLNAVRSYAG